MQKLIAERDIDPDAWEFTAMGEAVPPVALGRGAMLVAAPSLGLDDYAAQMRSSDVLFSPMLLRRTPAIRRSRWQHAGGPS